jgi:hypothetical protein
MLVTSLLIMGVATFVIGLLPTYHSIGVLAPILLVRMRFAQGIGVGGEWGGAVLMAVEHSAGTRRGFHGSWPQMGVPAGCCSRLSSSALLLCFFRGRISCMGLARAVPAQRGPDRSRAFHSPSHFGNSRFPSTEAACRHPQPPIATLLRNYPRNVLLGHWHALRREWDLSMSSPFCSKLR